MHIDLHAQILEQETRMGFAIATNTGVTSIQILSNATGDVEILALLNIKSSLTTIVNDVSISGSFTCSDFKPLGSGGILRNSMVQQLQKYLQQVQANFLKI
jgi:hypothetical protein